MLDVAPPGGPWVEVDRAEVRRPGDVRDLGHAELVRVTAGRKAHAGRLDPVGSLLGHPFLVDRLALRPVRVSLELGRSVVEGPHDPVGDGDVVLDEVELRLPALGEEDLVWIGDANGTLSHLELDERRPAHGRQNRPTSAPGSIRRRFGPRRDSVSAWT
jgi:hypothetical protein